MALRVETVVWTTGHQGSYDRGTTQIAVLRSLKQPPVNRNTFA